MKFTLELTVEEGNTILSSLSKMPYEQVAALIHKVKTEAETQLQKKQAEEVENGKVDKK